MTNESKPRPGIKVLMYHSVVDQAPNQPTKMHYVTTDVFIRHMQMIDWFGFTPITFIDYKLYKEGKLTLPVKPIIITFDDGYVNTFENALPVMLKYDMKGVVFVLGDRTIRKATWNHEHNDSETNNLMNDQQLREMRKIGFEIGAHTMSHANLLDLNHDEVAYQIQFSKHQIEAVLNEPVYSFAYPYGAVNQRIQSVVRKVGFEFACGVYTGAARFEDSVLDFRRLSVDQYTPLYKFLMKLLTPYQYLEWGYHSFKKKRASHTRRISRNMVTEVKQ